ncbi:phosphatase PAP2 family protein [Myroides marinus]|uniref:phosphatase PAP2 family protein n=1 Tax=Myroides marinus TaxID=703342 RepID=UPI0025791605|nr:phosphatase PAP2 family protein [Myroides marinus]MDM1353842.1 phosphatase PAP2 family protein [Myroides marinus]MDM1372130.1 phosphatase PAP2 family protein [Myroides marinus]MDM1389791.1 phosphatase PAP2 family protein [Myroides marinus]MDM1501692.1 phosphatase PAP2 family protein [Myroides marinus]
MKRYIYLITIILLSTNQSFSQFYNKNNLQESIQLDTNFSFTPENAKRKSFFEKDAVQIALVPTLFLTASALTWNSKEDIREQRNRYVPSFQYKYDDILQYAPAATVFGLKAAGVKGRNDIKRTTISYGASMAIMAILVNSIKYTAKVERPDGSSKNSFPSGHTAMAFANAAFLDKEYGLVNPLYSIGGYGAATMTGLGRSLNNRHWVPDILAGAGIGILSTQLAYFFVDKIYGNKGDNLSLISKLGGNENPSFLAVKLGFTSGLESIVETEDEEALAKLGWEAGLEGAYFFNKHWGLGGQIAVASFPFSEDKVNDPDDPNIKGKVLSQSMGNLTFSVGPYYAIHFSDRWNLMIKALGGYSIGADGNISLKVLSHEVHIPELEDGKVQLAEYKPANVFQFTTGLALTYNITDNLGITAYSDFNHSQSKITYKINDDILEEGDLKINTVKHPLNYLSMGIRLTAYF